jgi:uncharacterized DUF497 family protein
MRFEWDPKKEILNLAKHGISFDEGSTVFDDFEAVIFDDPKHSASEHREIIIGTSSLKRLLLVSYTTRGKNIRIISVRSANKKERMKYESYKKTQP